MTAYLLTFRTPPGPGGPSAFEAWAGWQLKLGARLRDRGNPVFTAVSLGASAAGTSLGGYSLIRAVSLDEAVSLAQGCPMLAAGGGVEVGELTCHDDMFDEWLGRHA
jgi:hypothetical protein